MGELELRDTDVGVVERIYYAVPTNYSIGEEFPLDGLATQVDGAVARSAAIAFAKDKIKRFDYPMLDGAPTTFSREVVDLRYVIRKRDGTKVDMSVERFEVKLTEAEKEAKVAA